MKLKLFSISLLLLSTATFAQNRIGLDLGVGVPSFSNGGNAQSGLPNYTTNVVFTGEAYYLRKVARHIYIGGKAAFEEYSFDYNKAISDGQGGSIGTDVNHKSSYLHIGPMIDVGIGKRREYLHGFLFATVGLLMNGVQTTNDYHIQGAPLATTNNFYESDYKVNSAIVRIGFGLKQQLPLSKTWYFNFTEGYSFMPFGDLSQTNATGGADLHPGYFTFMVGVMHKFKDTRYLSEN